VIGERGMRLSGGAPEAFDRARLLQEPADPDLRRGDLVARLGVREPDQEAIEKLMKDRTVLIIAHRLSSVIHAGKIVVLDAGRIIDEGTHQVLLERCAKYRQFYELQLLGTE